ncbi:ankyrin and het domain-containing protein [Colletotrichum sojae]|uniref:Ankyrin and het domain-containing protein n=1 Tax=Colletotrichum sojae TaxID=2175907 RepID=A0A8H6JKW4_9PEZI|nr:ankyrin and het domain-containing protein [Colletotrichum sojae]
MSAYQYEPLSAPDSIRLLLLEPFASYRDDILRGYLLNTTTLWECDYDLIDNYTALSYVWGSGEKPCQILLDGQAFAITRSLHNALRDLRDGTRVRRVWADAVCINQLDIPERNGQVALMRRIYSGANNTVIYLGDLTVHVSGVFAAASPRQLHNSAPAAPAAAEDASGGVTAVAVRDLLSRPWFKRVWVFQELVLSRDPWVQCGRARIRWNDFCRLLLVNSQTLLTGCDKSDLQILEDMNAARNRKKGYTLVEALKARRGLGATDPRNLVYANLAVVEDAGLQVNYEKTSQWIYARTAIHIVDKLGMRVLMPHLDEIAGERLEGLPSWAPDWRLPSSALMPLPRLDTGLDTFYDTLDQLGGMFDHVFVQGDG